MVTGGNRETNLVAMVAVKANSVKWYLTETNCNYGAAENFFIPGLATFVTFLTARYPKIMHKISCIEEILECHVASTVTKIRIFCVGWCLFQ
jgi:hypothetical protein